ncbi:hypothetical protein [Microcoleus sp. FACHB-SPT15]|uniref:hypothetical protein n=1 Tax=Microcoleus sp. FACHB-SPT15 TaxID=2692830 RepID=UPI0018F01B04|nr:hypothetical protein [Microcoleus sp. FACHB-SPT15]
MDNYKTSSNQLQTTPSIDPALEQAIAFLTTPSAKPPAPEAVVEALLQAEKTAKQSKVRHTYPQLLGTWRLGFITGTKRSRKRAGVILGAGRFLPSWVKIHLSYLQSESNQEQGTVQNSVELGLLKMVLTGPTQFWSKTNMLAFDFTRMRVSLSGLKLYDGYIRKGQEREVRFYEQGVKEQAFFTYFLVENLCLAARGRGGGLALWTRVKDS